MPCRDDYIDPSSYNQEIQRAAKLIIYIKTRQVRHVDDWVIKESNNIYASAKSIVPYLCQLLKNMSESEIERIVYNAHDPRSRDLANWWETHQNADRIREIEEQRQKEIAELRKSAIAKLTPEEKAALGVSE